MEEEIWLPIAGYTGLYEVSSLGRVRSLDYRHDGRVQVLKPITHANGYLQVTLYKDGKCKKCTVHRLVAEAFLPNVEGLSQVNHKDECKTNNAVSNLEWCTASYNLQYGTAPSRRAAAQSKPVEQRTKDGRLLTTWPSLMEAWRQTGIRHISECCNGKQYTAGGFIWRYVE